MFKKILCALLATCMLAGSLIACANDSDETNETKDNQQTGASTEEDTRETLDIPPTRYDGKELCFLVRGGTGAWCTVEVFADSSTTNSDNISYAVFERNDKILQNYGVTIVEYRSEDHHTDVSNELAAPTGDFQAIATNVTNSASFASSGYLWNLNSDDVQYVDTQKPWWDTKMAEGMSIDNRLYFVTGDIMTLDNDATFAIMFNKSIATDCKLPNLYELVDNGQWTLNRLYEFEQTAVQDKDGQNGLSYDNDVCGFAYTQDVPTCILVGGGVTLTAKDEDDVPFYAMDVELAQDISDIGKLIFSKDYTVHLNLTGLNDVEASGKKCFGENHALFFGECLQCVTRVRGYDVDFGILPYPKFSATQDSYYSLMHSTASVVSIPKSVTGDDLAMVDAMIEAMAYYSVDTLTKQYYEINLKTKGAKDAESGPMIDTILANRACDLAYYFGWGNGYGDIAACLLPAGTISGAGGSIASVSTRSAKSIKNGITTFLRKMQKFD